MKYAYINTNNKVENVIVCDDENFRELMKNIPAGIYPGTWVKVTKETGVPHMHWNYSHEKNKFYGNQPFPSWIFDSDVLEWKAPKEQPEGRVIWSENLLDWIELEVNVCPDCSV